MYADVIELLSSIKKIVLSIDVSTLLAWCGAIVSMSSARSAKKQLKLMQDKEKKRKPNLNIKIDDAVNVYNHETSALDYFFDILVKNNTDIDNSVTRIQLHIRYEFNSTSLFHISDYIGKFKINDKKITSNIPISIGANQSERISCHFAFPYDWIVNIAISDYTIKIYDTHDNSYIDTNIFVLGEMRYEDIK